MPHFFVTCARGLEPLLLAEIHQLGAESAEIGRGGVSFTGDLDLLYRANLWLRTAVRVLHPIWEGPVASYDELYAAVQSLDWSEFMTPDHTLAVDCNVRDSALTHSQYASRRVKDAICDQFRERVGRRPSVDTERPMVGLNLHVYRNHATLSRDSSWDSLHKRGYRPIQHRAPLNEALAAGLLMSTGWDGSTPLVDPLCGSGTFLIEGAWLVQNRPPGLTRKWFGFMGWLDFDRALWNAIRDEARAQAKPGKLAILHGSDVRNDALQMARQNAKSAGVGHMITWKQQALKDARPPEGEPGLVICNPPYGERLGEEREWRELYRSLGQVMQQHWPGWKLAVFTSNDRLARLINLPRLDSQPFFNGSLACRLWTFGTT